MTNAYESIALARVADILFCSYLTAEQCSTNAQVFTAIRESLAAYGGWKACMGEVTHAFVADIDAAAERLMWCRTAVAVAWSGAHTGHSP